MENAVPRTRAAARTMVVWWLVCIAVIGLLPIAVSLFTSWLLDTPHTQVLLRSLVTRNLIFLCLGLLGEAVYSMIRNYEFYSVSVWWMPLTVSILAFTWVGLVVVHVCESLNLLGREIPLSPLRLLQFGAGLTVMVFVLAIALTAYN